MRIHLTKITVRDLTEGYDNKFEDGVTGFGGKLDIRPKFQREFVYNPLQRDAVIDSVMNGYPISVMYWLKGADDKYELMDGQQRTISICEYVEGSFAVNNEYFFKLSPERQEQILNYPILVYIVENGTDEENLAWFRKINTAGEKLTNQEIRNAVYTSAWVTDAKKYFSKTFCPAIKLGEDYMTGLPLRQDYLETVLRWVSGGKIDEYMAEKSRSEQDASALWEYFNDVIKWVKGVFPTYHKEMRGVEWGDLYNKYKDRDTTGFNEKFEELYADDEVESKRGIYYFLFENDERDLDIAKFSQATLRETFKAQGGKCKVCGQQIPINRAIAIRYNEWKDGGKLTHDNCRVICSSCEMIYFREPVTEYIQRDEKSNRFKIIRQNDHKVLLDKGLAALPELCSEMIPIDKDGNVIVKEKAEAPTQTSEQQA